MNKKTFTETVSAGMAKANPELLNAPKSRMKEKVKRSVRAYLLALVSIALLAGGCWFAWDFGAAAREQKQVVSFWLMLSLLVPLIPGVFVGAWALLRFDSDAGGVFTQLITLIGAVRQAIKPTSPPAGGTGDR